MKLRYFAWLRTRIGKSEEVIEKPSTVTSAAELLEWLSDRGEPYTGALARREIIRVAVNHEYVKGDFPLADGDEVALFPPVTGG